jgi:hypothetical protein
MSTQTRYTATGFGSRKSSGSFFFDMGRLLGYKWGMSMEAKNFGATNSVLEIGINGFLKIASKLTPNVPILLIGDHAKGKSAAVYQAAAMRRSAEFLNVAQATTLTKLMLNDPLLRDQLNSWHQKFPNLPAEWKGVWHYDFGLPVVERRLSQIQSGELNGLPREAELGTVFSSMQWLAICSKVPCFLFLDELNRATRENEQGCFQLTDSRCIGTTKLHPETMIAAAANASSEYDVSTPDPASLSRFAVWRINPTVSEWLSYMGERYRKSSEITDFLKCYSNHIEAKVSMEPWFKTPDRRAWERVYREVETHDLLVYGIKKIPEDAYTYALGYISGLVGFPAANALLSFVNEGRESVVTPEMCFKNWKVAKYRLPSNGDRTQNNHELNTRFVSLHEGIVATIKTQELSDYEIEQLQGMMEDFPPELGMRFFQAITQKGGPLMEKMSEFFSIIMPRLLDAAHG